MSARNMLYRKDKTFSKAEEKIFAREELIFNVTEDLLVILEDKAMTKTTLARALGKSKSYVTQILNGKRNMTLGSLSDICFALGFKPEIKLPVFEGSKLSPYESIEWIDILDNGYITGNAPKHAIEHASNNVIRPKQWQDCREVVNG